MEHEQLKRINSSESNSVINSSKPQDWAMVLHPVLSTSIPGASAPGDISITANPRQAGALLRMESQAEPAEAERKSR